VFYRVLELAAGHDPVRYPGILAAGKPRSKPPLRPWRTAEIQLRFPLK
jgi:hypothetical protein